MAGGWVGRILRVDLTEGRIEVQDTSDYLPDYLGGRGIATRVAWDELRPGTRAFDPDNLLMAFTGPLAGTTAPFSGRTGIFGLGPQGYPFDWFTRAGLGGHWGPALKYAGFDGVVVRGQSERPVYLWVHDGKAELRDAAHLWGLGTYATQQELMAELGEETRVLTIGQAGERLSRIAIINTETESAAGQGGFGAVMGAKRLKAIAVHGQGVIQVARPADFLAISQAIAAEFHRPAPGRLDPERQRKYGQKWQACSQQCTRPCAVYYRSVPGVVFKGATHAGQVHCAAGLFAGQGGRGFYRWEVGFEAGFEAARLANDYGLNHWDVLFGVAPWLAGCVEAGLIRELDGRPADLSDPFFWADLLRKIAYREGVGDVLAEGGWRASRQLGVGEEIADELYAAWGYAGHWDGHGDHANRVVFPFWVVPALQWAVDTRDPISSGHGYASHLMSWCPFNGRDDTPTWEQIEAIGEQLYGTPRAVDPLSGYDGKAQPAIWHGHRSVLKDSVSLDDYVFPRLYSKLTPDGLARAVGPNGLVMDGPSYEYHLFTSATGVPWSPDDLERACERILNLDRCLHVRHWGRARKHDESVIPYLERPENWPNPLLGERQRLDRERFRGLLDEYYRLRGWDVETGRPTPARLEALGLSDVAREVRRAYAFSLRWRPRSRLTLRSPPSRATRSRRRPTSQC